MFTAFAFRGRQPHTVRRNTAQGATFAPETGEPAGCAGFRREVLNCGASTASLATDHAAGDFVVDGAQRIGILVHLLDHLEQALRQLRSFARSTARMTSTAADS
ncbi:hypothetical protein P4234_32075 [Pseudomonas aeruginosa]|nr:hypothetical protein [Pseudomonas aeruginosa]